MVLNELSLDSLPCQGRLGFSALCIAIHHTHIPTLACVHWDSYIKDVVHVNLHLWIIPSLTIAMYFTAVLPYYAIRSAFFMFDVYIIQGCPILRITVHYSPA